MMTTTIIIIIIGTSFMQGIYTYIPGTNHVPREHRVAAILVLLFMVLISLVPTLAPLYFYVSTFRSMCAVPNMAVFCSSLTSWFPGMLLTYFLNDFEMVPIAPIITVLLLLLLLFLLLLTANGLIPVGSVLQCNTVQYNTIQYSIVQYNTIQYSTIQYNTIQYNIVQYNTISVRFS